MEYLKERNRTVQTCIARLQLLKLLNINEQFSESHSGVQIVSLTQQICFAQQNLRQLTY